jgi:hypothetical protein
MSITALMAIIKASSIIVTVLFQFSFYYHFTTAAYHVFNVEFHTAKVYTSK